MRLEPVEQRPGEVQRHPHAGVPFERRDDRRVADARGFLEHPVDVAERLVIVDRENEARGQLPSPT